MRRVVHQDRRAELLPSYAAAAAAAAASSFIMPGRYYITHHTKRKGGNLPARRNGMQSDQRADGRGHCSKSQTSWPALQTKWSADAQELARCLATLAQHRASTGPNV